MNLQPRIGAKNRGDAWKNTARVDKLATQATSFAEVKGLLGVEGVPKAPGKALRDPESVYTLPSKL
jgi:hypothetical protein